MGQRHPDAVRRRGVAHCHASRIAHPANHRKGMRYGIKRERCPSQ